jgi:hypothetical protein
MNTAKFGSTPKTFCTALDIVWSGSSASLENMSENWKGGLETPVYIPITNYLARHPTGTLPYHVNKITPPHPRGFCKKFRTEINFETRVIAEAAELLRV